MRRSGSLALVALLAVACRHPEEPRLVVVPPVHRPDPVDPIAPGLTHGAFIRNVAVTEAGDAALTVDQFLDVRLWPTLDGTRPPVPLGVVGARQLALGHAGKNLLAAILGEAGDVSLLQLGLDGSVRGRAQVPGDVPCRQVIANGADVLVVRADQSIERYDADARLRDRVVAETGEQIETIAVRRGHAVVLISGKGGNGDQELDGEAGTLKHLELDGTLRWGATITLTAPVVADAIALSPDGSHIAVMDGRKLELQVLQLSTRDVIGTPVQTTTTNVRIGFTDDDHVAIVSSDVRWWQAPFQTPGSAPVVPDISDVDGGAVGDGVAIGGRGAALVIATPRATRYLGWRVPAFGTINAIGSQLVVSVWNTAFWLDSQLRSPIKRELESRYDPRWIGPHHTVIENSGVLELVDTDHPDKTVVIGKGTARNVFYEPTLHILGAYLYNGTVERYTLDLEHLGVTRLAPLGVSPNFSSEGAPRLALLDPTRTDGVIAIARWYGHKVHQADRTHVAIYREGGESMATISPTREIVVAEAPAIDATGALYLREKEKGPLVVRRDGTPDVVLPDPGTSDLVPSHDGQRFAILRDNEVVLFDGRGVEQWRRAVWSTRQLVFSSDDRHVIVGSSGGILSFDATTGTRMGASCAFDFGLHEQPIPVNALQAPPACEAAP